MLEGIAELIGNVLEDVYDPAQLLKVTREEAKDGDITEQTQEHNVFLHPVARSEAYRQQAGFADDVVEVIVLAIHIPGIEIDTDDKLVADDSSWDVIRAKLDGPKSQWKCVCREIKNG